MASVSDCFTLFKEDIDSFELPGLFTYPFYYEPHPLCRIAAKELQDYLMSQTDWVHDFGIDHYVEGSNIGKMFGVLVVQNEDGLLGYLSAFSGKLAGSNHHPRFVPPIYDLLNKDGFFRKGEDIISGINAQINELEQAQVFMAVKEKLSETKRQAQNELDLFKAEMKDARNKRKDKRAFAEKELEQGLFEELKEKLKQESLKYQYDYKQLVKYLNQKTAVVQDEVNKFTCEIDALKEERKQRSAALQQKLFDQYQFLNQYGENKGVCDIFENTAQKIPPAGAGDCAAPKLLQFAFQNNLKPIAMAEFWWGQSPSSEIRKHKYFYPSCKGKCEPILGHMLKGIPLDENPIDTMAQQENDLEIIYEDDYLLVVNKPADFLSVPGKIKADSVYSRIQHLYPNATGPLIVHRLDMSTSGVMVIAKTKEIHKQLQSQFLDKMVRKQYIALLDGILKHDKGTIDLPIRVDLEDRPRQLVCYEYGKPARTRWRVLERYDNKTKVQFTPITGRTHQLRVHAAHPKGLNTPILGDDLYGKKSSRLHLHAEQLEFVHPVSKEIVRVRAEVEF